MLFSHRRLGLAVLSAATLFSSLAHADEPLPAAEILQELRSFRTLGTVLHLAAHPDDENTQLITYLARGRGYRAGYLSLTRGDGGQNELGPDFDERLGVARTQELLAARRLDNGRQFFTRAIDFGFSKSPEETLQFWDRAEVLSDVVRVIRAFRPDVIVTRFPIPPGNGGHGHHTASAMLTVEAFKIAGDPSAYPEQLAQGLTPWQPKRVVWNVFGGNRGTGGLDGPTVEIDIGGNDPVTGESFGTIANRSRGMHKTQGLGVFSNRDGGGPNVQKFMLLAGEPATNDLMDGIDVSWNRIPGGAAIGRLADELIASFKTEDPAASVPALVALRSKLATLPSDPLLDDKRAQLDRVLTACLGLTVETTLPNAEVLSGAKLALRHTVLTRAAVPVRWLGVRYPASATQVREPISLRAGVPATRQTEQTLPADTPLTQPYWLREDGAAGIARVADPALIGLPENPPVFPVEHLFEVEGQTLIVPDEPVQINGTTHRRVAVISPVSLKFISDVALFAPNASRTIEVEVTSSVPGASGELRLETPNNWKVSAPAARSFNFKDAGDRQRFQFTVHAPSQPTTARFGACAKVNGREIRNIRSEVRYDHLPRQLLQPPARLRATALDVKVKAKTIGYLPGAGDAVAASLEQLGCTVSQLNTTDLSPEKLRDFDAVVLGVRAFNERGELSERLPNLLSYVENGGTVIVQYNRPNGLKDKPLGPYPLSIQGGAPQFRVTDENAAVTFLAPDHPALNTPNKITSGDFAGWLQERGAYFPSEWDEAHYTALLAMNDPGQDPLKSGLLVAKHGSGYFVYTGLSFFRQLPAGVPGAYRLFANLISLGK
ncbi:MAG TPA: PIG-L family deacetylase [Opitutus sp.]|nr:PIG-L family deacetylase [Opitutus sp.]